ncbi:hypothetical protein EDD53_1583 [Pacificibacter maritimus]|uniref:Uncharacterized protein n=1 Tax=Pacificibacter maritimus TaxID=762213 RepID=A0A3N4UIU0_9RHOB|nr:hypothetical protein EDD53_1583 [Pacificibacter maritimus]
MILIWRGSVETLLRLLGGGSVMCQKAKNDLTLTKGVSSQSVAIFINFAKIDKKIT